MSDATIIEAPIGVTLKCSDDRDAPWITLRATDVQQLQSQLHELENSGVLVDIGRVAALFQIKARLGSQLGATPLDPDIDGGSFDGVKASATVAKAPAEKPPVATTPPAAPVKKAGGFPSFGAAKPAAKAPATTPPPAKREAATPPPAAAATGTFPAAPAWSKK